MSTRTNFDFEDWKENGEIVNKDGYHQPGSNRYIANCGCSLTTGKGAYRDVSIRDNDTIVHYYHQSPVVVENGDLFRISSCGWKTSTTKERINRHLPRGFRVFQEDFEWYVETPEETLEFKDGMKINTE